MANTLTHRIRLDKLSAEALFVQVENSLNSAIESGGFLPGERIPTELELADIYGVSRITVRRAINELCQHGLLVKRQGRGTFVQERRMSRKIEHIASFTVSCGASGMVPTAAVLKRELLKSLPPGFPRRPEFENDQVLYIKRVHYADGVPIMIENNYYPNSRYSFLMSEPLEGSLFEKLTEHGIKVGGSENSYIDAIGATSDQAGLLSVRINDPLFAFYREMLDEHGGLIYVGLQHIVASRYRFAYNAA